MPAKSPKPTRAKARVMYHSDCVNPFAGMRQDRNEYYFRPVVVTPCATLKQARAKARWEQKERESKYRVILRTICYVRYGTSDACLEIDKQQARAVLALIDGGEGK